MDDKLVWFKSSYSANGQSCVECARTPDGGMAVRDTKNRAGAVLKFTADDWQGFIAAVHDGKFD